MTLELSLTEQIARARADLRMGVILLYQEQLVIPTETLSSDRLDDLRATSRDLTLVLTAHRAKTLKLVMAAYDGDLADVTLLLKKTYSG